MTVIIVATPNQNWCCKASVE